MSCWTKYSMRPPRFDSRQFLTGASPGGKGGRRQRRAQAVRRLHRPEGGIFV
jgi:hypothetical protein